MHWFITFCFLLIQLCAYVQRIDAEINFMEADVDWSVNYGIIFLANLGMCSSTSFNYEQGVSQDQFAWTEVQVGRSTQVVNCLARASLVSSAAIGIASIVVLRSKARVCADTGVLQITATHRVYFQYSATRTNWDTTVEKGTAQGAVTKWFKNNSGNRVIQRIYHSYFFILLCS